MNEMDRRVIACIRACDGVPLTTLETIAAKGGFAKGVMFLMEQTKELLSSLETKAANVVAGRIGDDQIKYMVDRFLGWKLPENFSPDAGISFKANYGEGSKYPGKHEPVGTNLFDATQAETMIRYLVHGMPVANDNDPTGALYKIASIIEQVDQRAIRAMVAGRPVTLTNGAITFDEIRRIYALSKGHPENWRPGDTTQEQVKQTIHILDAGITLCGMACRVDVEWPPGHTWVSRYSANDATCAICVLQHKGMGPV